MTDLWSEKQKRDLKYFEKKLNDFIDDNILKGKYLVINDEELKSSFDTFELALKYSLENFPKDEFIIQQAISSNDVVSYLSTAV